MARLFVYGCSFSASEGSINGWSLILKDLLNIEMKNFAVGGASSEYAMAKFESSVRNNEINDDDIIIMQLSSVGRIHLQFQNKYPSTAAQFNHEVPRDNPQYDWWKWNRSHLEWLMANTDLDLLRTNREAYVHIMKSYAEAYPKRTILVLENCIQEQIFPIKNTPNNFLKPKFDINQVAINEIDNKNFDDFVKFTQYDFRDNHLCDPNNKILAAIIYESIQNKYVYNFTYDKFQQNIISRIDTLPQYFDYVNRGLLTYVEWRESTLARNLTKI